ncbi:RluA family pseudouridine synthase [Vibrio sp. NTOU-M3]|uniref:RluA family pseudouridine synthase n=1 Tax=Vibrio sp. NTOU-M3 TaxID=3234954 RepID=UPI00349F1524
MHQPEQLFTRFTTPISEYALPERFTFPFYYQPHPLCELAAHQLQQHLLEQREWQHNFGVETQETTSAKAVGKMFGVLIVKNQQGEIGFLSAFSGKIADQNLLPCFVPPVFDMLTNDGFFKNDLAAITTINEKVIQLTTKSNLAELQSTLERSNEQYQEEEEQQRANMIQARAARKQKRHEASRDLNEEQLSLVLDELAKESVAEKNVLKYLKQEWEQRIGCVQNEVDHLNHQIDDLKEQRKSLSNALQHKLFTQYRFLNADGEYQDLNQIFAANSNPIPPAGAGECAAPKLLHYAYMHQMQPIAMAEFWWGTSPKSEVRQHKKFYPSCHSKCQPILGHMLKGLLVDPNPLEENWAENKELEILYQDDAIVVVNKPSGLLSVPGKTIKDSAYTRLQTLFPDVEGPYVIHRLDMATSGILVFALTKRANKSLQKQFITRGVEKRYVALIEGELQPEQGEISLPLRGDPDDRPRQLVCFEHGKPALTTWQVIEVKDGRTKLYLHPKTGRTHQLRVHCAHHLGLNKPMVGDGLYGEKANRLHLHAELLQFDHPYAKQRMTFQADSDF